MAQRSDGSSPSAERRIHYRIDDEVFLEYRPVHKTQLNDYMSHLRRRGNGKSGLINDLNELSRQSQAQLKGIRKSHPLIARYLSILDQKIDLLAQHVAARDDSGNGRPNHRVNLSAGGLAFYSDQQVAPESLLAISLKLFPSHREITTYGTVVYCRRESDSDPSTPYRVGVNFSFIRNMDRESLISHVLDKQFAAARAQRQPLSN